MAVLVSGVQKVIQFYIYIFFSIMVYYKIPNIIPGAVQ